jgi:hypothetical protein
MTLYFKMGKFNLLISLRWFASLHVTPYKDYACLHNYCVVLLLLLLFYKIHSGNLMIFKTMSLPGSQNAKPH